MCGAGAAARHNALFSACTGAGIDATDHDQLDALYLEDHYSGSRRMVGYLTREGIPISRGRMRNLMHRMGLRAIYRKPRTTVPGDTSERFPYLVAIVDLFSRSVPSWKLPNSIDTEFCLDTQRWKWHSEVAVKPEVFHSDRGCKFTCFDFVARLQAEKIKISWSGRKHCYDNILMQRCSKQSSMRRCSCMPTPTAERQRSSWPGFYGDTLI